MAANTASAPTNAATGPASTGNTEGDTTMTDHSGGALSGVTGASDAPSGSAASAGAPSSATVSSSPHDYVNPSWLTAMGCEGRVLRDAVCHRWYASSQLSDILHSWSPNAIAQFVHKWNETAGPKIELGPWGGEPHKKKNVKVIVAAVQKHAEAHPPPEATGKTRAKTADSQFKFLSTSTSAADAAILVESDEEARGAISAAAAAKKTSARAKSASVRAAKPTVTVPSDAASAAGITLSADVRNVLDNLPGPPRGSPGRVAASPSSARSPPAIRRTAGKDFPSSMGRSLLVDDDGDDDDEEPTDDSDSEDGDYIPSDDGSDGVQSDRDDGGFHTFTQPRLASGLAGLGSVEGFAREFLSRALADDAATVYSVYKYNVKMVKERNVWECLALAKVIDALLRKDHRLALELACRRLAGVQTADKSGNWGYCAALELNHEEQSFVPPRILARIIKRESRMRALANSGTSAGSSGQGQSKGYKAGKKNKNGTGGHSEGKGDKSSGSKKK